MTPKATVYKSASPHIDVSNRTQMTKSVTLSLDDAALVCEFLRLGNNELRSLLQSVYRSFPEANLCERIRVWMEDADTLRARLEAL